MCSTNKTKPGVAVIIPAYNEEGAIGSVVQSVRVQPLVRRVLVVDNGSTDATARIAKGAGAVVVTEIRRGYGSACLAGVAAVQEEELVCFIDGDGSDFPEELASLLQPILDERADLVVGSRILGSMNKSVLPFHQRLGNKIAGLLLGLPFGVRLTDLGPFRVIRREVLSQLDMQDQGYGWTIEMELSVLQKGFRLVEIPVRYRKRIAGKSKISGTIKGSFLAAIVILSVIAKGYIRNVSRGKCGKHSC